MRSLLSRVLLLGFVTAACSSSSSSASDTSGGAAGGGGTSAGSGGASSTGASGGHGGESAGSGGGATASDVCSPPIDLVDTSSPTSVVGNGTAASCTEAALDAALATGGVITFSCGDAPVTITLTTQKELKTDTVLDGGGTITLSGGGTTRILHVASAWDQTSPHVTVQRLSFVDGFAKDVPNTKDTTQGGAAIFREGGSLDVVDCSFANNRCADSGQDVSGGAITSQGVGNTVVVRSSFSNNRGSNGGAIGNLGNGLTVVDCTFDGNMATGTDGNPGNGGDGGAIVFDGKGTTMAICGSSFTHDTAGAQGGAIFRVAYADEPTIIDRSTFDSNAADPQKGLAGALYLEDTTIAMTASTISNNTAHYGGGIWIGHAAVARIVNVTIADNTADQGGGIWVAGEVTGSIASSTIAGNQTTPGGYAPAVFTGATELALLDCIVEGGGCKDGPLASGGPNLQHPDGSAPCTASIASGDPMLGPLADNGGPTKTMLPAAGSAAIAMGTSCPPTDQRGKPRATPCTLGAVEP